MRELLEVASDLQRVVEQNGWQSCIIGGLAVLRWGEPRLTNDVDLSLFTGFADEARFARGLLATFEPRISDALEFAVANRVLLLQSASGIPIDVAFAAFPFEAEIIERGSLFEFLPGLVLRTVSAEDLIVLKAFANRHRDWADIAGIVGRQPSLDWGAILERLTPLVELKGDPRILEELSRIRSA